MDKGKLREQLKHLIDEYIEDVELAENLINTLEDPKAKYVLSVIELNKSKDYSSESKSIIEDIAFYYC